MNTRVAPDPSTSADTIEFVMPSLGADMSEGRITEWLVGPGDEVERGQIVVIVETDKADIEVEVFEPATVVRLLVDEGELVPVGTPIAELRKASSRPETGHSETGHPETSVVHESGDTHQTAEQVEHLEPAEPAEVASAHGRSRITSPLVRHLVDDLHVDTGRLRGSGPGGRVRRDDVESASGSPARRLVTPRAQRLIVEYGLDPATLADLQLVTGGDVIARAEASPAVVPEPAPQLSRADKMRRKIADQMTRSWEEIPHFHVSSRFDLATATERLTTYNADRTADDRVVMGALLLTAAARAAIDVPACNGWWRDDGFVPATTVDLGVVLSLRTGGIIVPTIDHAEQLSPSEVMRRLDELVQRARQGRLRASDLGEASVTVTNLGDRGAETVSGVIHPPQVALVGFGAVHDEIWPADPAPEARPTIHVSLAGDHRAIDGLTASRFLTRLRAKLDGRLLDDA